MLNFDEFKRDLKESNKGGGDKKERSPKSGIYFEIVSEIPSNEGFLLMDKNRPGDIYFMDMPTIEYSLNDEIHQYLPYERTLIGKDEDGFPEYDYEYDTIDDDGIYKITLDTPKNKIGIGLDDMESGDYWITKLDLEAAQDLYETLARDLKVGYSTRSSKNRIYVAQKKLGDFISSEKRKIGIDDSLGLDLPI